MVFVSDPIYHKVVEETQQLFARLAPDSTLSSEEVKASNTIQLDELEVLCCNNWYQ